MADFLTTLNGVATQQLWVPVAVGTTTGLTLGTLGSLEVATDGVRDADPAANLSLVLVEVDSGSQPGLYYLSLTPVVDGTLVLRFTVGGDTYTYIIQVSSSRDADAALEGDYTITLNDGASPAQGAVIRVYDASGFNLITRGVTDASGEATFTLPVGNYQFRAFKDGIDFSSINPTTITVSPNSQTSPELEELLPATGSIGDAVVLRGEYFDDTCEVVWGSEVTAAAAFVSPDGKVLLAEVPAGLTASIIAVRVVKDDPLNPPSGTLLSNSVTFVRT